MRSRMRYLTTIMVMTAFLLALPLAATAEELPTGDKQARLEQHIQKDTGMTDGEIATFRYELQTALKNAGSESQLRNLVQAAHSNGCKGECIGTALQLCTRITTQEGMTAGQAQAMIKRQLKNTVRVNSQKGLTDTELGQMLQLGIEQELAKGSGQAGGTKTGETESTQKTGSGRK